MSASSETSNQTETQTETETKTQTTYPYVTKTKTTMMLFKSLMQISSEKHSSKLGHIRDREIVLRLTDLCLSDYFTFTQIIDNFELFSTAMMNKREMVCEFIIKNLTDPQRWVQSFGILALNEAINNSYINVVSALIEIRKGLLLIDLPVTAPAPAQYDPNHLLTRPLDVAVYKLSHRAITDKNEGYDKFATRMSNEFKILKFLIEQGTTQYLDGAVQKNIFQMRFALNPSMPKWLIKYCVTNNITFFYEAPK